MGQYIYRQHTGLLSSIVDQIRNKTLARQLTRNQNVLDLGCGPALIISQLPEGCAYSGVDRDSTVINLNQQRFPMHTFVQVDFCGQKLPFAPNTFDAIVMGAVLEHINGFNDLFPELSRILKQGGQLIATTPSKVGIQLHHLLAMLHLLSHDAAQEHKGAFILERVLSQANDVGLRLKVCRYFEMGLNRLIIFQKESQ